jgi:ribosome-associated protein
VELFEISGDYIELNKLLKASGLCDSGGMAKMVITDGQVQVDGLVEYRIRRKIRNGQTVAFNQRSVGVAAGPARPEKSSDSTVS